MSAVLLIALSIGGCSTIKEKFANAIGEQDGEFTERVALTHNGLGPVSAATRFDADTVGALLPGYEVEAAQYKNASKTLVLLLNLEGKTLAELFAADAGDTVGRIDIVAGGIEGPYGEQVGIQLADASIPGIGCAPGGTTLDGIVVCSAGNDQRVDYLFELPENAAANATTLPTRAALDDSTLARMVWRAP